MKFTQMKFTQIKFTQIKLIKPRSIIPYSIQFNQQFFNRISIRLICANLHQHTLTTVEYGTDGKNTNFAS